MVLHVRKQGQNLKYQGCSFECPKEILVGFFWLVVGGREERECYSTAFNVHCSKIGGKRIKNSATIM